MPIKSLEELMRWKRYIRDHYNQREYLFVELALDTGTFPASLLDLKWDDLKSEECDFPAVVRYYFLLPREIQSPQKYKHVISNRTFELLKELRKQFPNDVYIFQTQSPNTSKKPPKPWSIAYIGRILRESALAAGLKETISPLTLRKSYGYHMVVHGTWTLRQLQQRFGQPRLSTTRKYINITNEPIIEDSLD